MIRVTYPHHPLYKQTVNVLRRAGISELLTLAAGLHALEVCSSVAEEVAGENRNEPMGFSNAPQNAPACTVCGLLAFR